jgi:signal transduction histidine kinase
VAVAAALIAVVVFGLPLAVAMRRVYVDEERRELTRLAQQGAAEVVSGSTQLPGAGSDTAIGLYTPDGRRTVGTGPARADEATGRALRGSLSERAPRGQLVVAVPVLDGDRVVGAVRAGVPAGAALDRTTWTWVGMAGLGVLAVTAGALVARWQAVRLARPLEDLATAARTLGGGDLTVRAPRSGVPEIDDAAEALDDTAGRLDRMLARERAFSAHASHQLRTPLTGLRLLLESAQQDDVTARALEAADRLERTIDDLLALARTPVSGSVRPLDVDALLGDVRESRVAQLGSEGRALRTVREDALPPVAVSTGAVRQVLAVLLDNATVHGRGTVTVRVRDAGGALAVDVEDEGEGPAAGDDPFRARGAGAGHGLGLPLARALAEAEGGRLVLGHPGPKPRFTLVLPAVRGESDVPPGGRGQR